MSSQFVYILSIHHSFRIFFSPAPPLATSKKRELDEGEKKINTETYALKLLKVSHLSFLPPCMFFFIFSNDKIPPSHFNMTHSAVLS